MVDSCDSESVDSCPYVLNSDNGKCRKYGLTLQRFKIEMDLFCCSIRGRRHLLSHPCTCRGTLYGL